MATRAKTKVMGKMFEKCMIAAAAAVVSIGISSNETRLKNLEEEWKEKRIECW